jgi:hypothetical protein
MKELKGVLAIAGKPGLYQLIAQTRTGIVVENLSDQKRTSIAAQQQVSALGEIAIYTDAGERPLKEIFESMALATKGQHGPHPKQDPSAVHAFFAKHVPDFDVDRVYASDMRKVVTWYNTLVDHGFFIEEPAAVADEPSSKPAKATKKKAAAAAAPVSGEAASETAADSAE